MKTKVISMLALAVFIMSYLGASEAKTAPPTLGPWELIGTHVVDYGLDHDVIDLNNTTETYTSIKIVVKQGSVNVHKATVHFANDDKQDIDLSKNLNTSTDETVIDLKGNDRVIKKVTFWYNTKNKSESKGVVEVWGKK
jgi:hypothetical protein